jgi:hypothetical protein
MYYILEIVYCYLNILYICNFNNYFLNTRLSAAFIRILISAAFSK